MSAVPPIVVRAAWMEPLAELPRPQRPDLPGGRRPHPERGPLAIRTN
jgi:hypothetical protein